MVDLLIRLYSNPNEGPRETTLHWPRYDDTDRMFMNIGLDSAAETLTPEMMESYIFWNKFYETAKLRGKSSRADMDRLPRKFIHIRARFLFRTTFNEIIHIWYIYIYICARYR